MEEDIHLATTILFQKIKIINKMQIKHHMQMLRGIAIHTTHLYALIMTVTPKRASLVHNLRTVAIKVPKQSIVLDILSLHVVILKQLLQQWDIQDLLTTVALAAKRRCTVPI